MMRNYLKQLSSRIKSNIYFTKNSYPHCGRDICYCLYKLDLNYENDKIIYKSCYDTWLKFNYKNTINQR